MSAEHEQAIQEIGFREVELRRIFLPPGFDAVAREPFIERLALSIQALGLLEPPTVRFSDMRPGPGWRRLAALLRLQAETCHVRLVECDNYTLELMRRAHNSDRSEWEDTELGTSTTARVRATADLIARLKPGMRYAGKGRGPTAHTEALRLIARETGVAFETLKQREYRERHRAPPVLRRGDPSSIAAPTINLLGIQVTDLFLDQVAQVQARLDDAKSSVALARRTINRLLAARELPRHTAKLRRLKELADELEESIARARPAGICPWCKGQPGIQESCAACEGSGYGTATQCENAPQKLLRADRPVVVRNGAEVLLHEYLEEEV